MKKLLLVAAVPALLFLTGCDYDFTTATATVNSVGLALVTNNYAKFESSLAGNAKATYGNTEGMSALQARLGGKALVTVPARLVSRGHCGQRCSSSVWYVQVLSGISHEMDVWVTCEHQQHGGYKLPPNFFTNSCRITDVR